MNKFIFVILFAFLLSSCDKESIVWNLKRINPKDTKLEPLELIYSNDCSDSTSVVLKCWGQKYNQMNGKKDTANCYWKQIDQTDNPKSYFEVMLDEKLGYDNNARIDSVTLEFDVNMETDFFLRFKFKQKEIKNQYSVQIGEQIFVNTIGEFVNGTSIDKLTKIINKISVNETFINVSLISEKYKKSSGAESSPTQEYKELNAYYNKWHHLQTEIISHNTKHIKIWFPNAVCISQIELWKPKY